MLYQNVVKPTLDFIIAFAAFIIAAPIIIVTTILLYINNDGKPFFLQARPGKKGKIFKIIKFKTMNDAKDAQGNLLPDDVRLHKVGRIVRKLSIDEILQLINVLKGDMSIVGPRPLLVEYLPLYNEEQRKRHDVKPGITGWAQVNGRNAISWEQKFQFDVFYVKNISLILDIKIVLLTIKKVLGMADINADANITMEKFRGSNNTPPQYLHNQIISEA